MKIFIDMEFTGLHQKTSLISIGLISEYGHKFYAEFTDYDKSQINDWLRDNVINNTLYISRGLPNFASVLDDYCNDSNIPSIKMFSDKNTIVDKLKEWLSEFDDIEIWGDCLAYDWVLFCELFGGARNLPKNISCIPFDISTVMKIKGINPDISRERFASKGNKLEPSKLHNAIDDAYNIKKCYERLIEAEILKSALTGIAEFDDIDIFIKDKSVNPNQYGYGHIYVNETGIISNLYQDRIDMDEIICSGDFDSSCENNKMYVCNSKTIVDAVNTFMNFWITDMIDKHEEIYIINDYAVVPALLENSFSNIVLIIKK